MSYEAFIWLSFWMSVFFIVLISATQIGIYAYFLYYKLTTDPFDFDKRLNAAEVLSKDNMFTITYKGWSNEHIS